MVISAHGGRVNRDDINNMARFLRKVENRLEKLAKSDEHAAAAAEFAEELIEDFKVLSQNEESALLRLQTGLLDLNELLQD
jgi:hypothetical protein